MNQKVYSKMIFGEDVKNMVEEEEYNKLQQLVQAL